MTRPALLTAACCLLSACTASDTASVAAVSAPTPVASEARCLDGVIHDLKAAWPNHAIVNIVAFGHSVPAGFGVTPEVHKRDAYPRLLEDALADAYPTAVLNVITSAVGGENSTQGRARFQRDVLDHHPRAVLIDYALNDRGLTLEESEANLNWMIGAVRAVGACPVLLTPSWDTQAHLEHEGDPLRRQAEMIRALGTRDGVPVADSLARFQQYPGDRTVLMAQFNHPNRQGHERIVAALLPLFVPEPPPL